ncbi:MAG TPA: hypothetical protein PLU25_14545 [Acidobacteriota bacterium]|nr:hypothetical protein [Acidobacteriota bacterium]
MGCSQNSLGSGAPYGDNGRMWPESIFGTGDRNYEARIGRLERRFVRQCRRLVPTALRARALAAALSAQEMDHWLFLNAGSLFRAHLAQLNPEGGRRIFLTLFSACLAGLELEAGLPDPGTGAWARLDALAAAAGEAAVVPSVLAARYRDRLGDRAAFQDLLAALAEQLPELPDLEATLTFGILAGQMLEKAAERCRRFL